MYCKCKGRLSPIVTIDGIRMTESGETDVSYFKNLLDTIAEGDSQTHSYWDLKNGDKSKKTLFREHLEDNLIIQEYLSEKIYYSYTKSDAIKSHTIKIKTRPDYVQISFCLKGKISYSTANQKETFFTTSPLSANLIYYKCSEVTLRAEEQGELEILIFNIHLNFISKNFQEIYPRIENFIEKTKADNAAVFSENIIPISPSLKAMIQDFTIRRYVGCFLTHYVELKTIEFVILLLNEFDSQSSISDSAILSEKDVEKILQAKTILLERMKNPPNLKELANMIGTNEYDLKRKFKQYYGQTVFGYLIAHKMNYAREKLLEGNFKIVEIAEELGYSHATHFTSAFKKMFGILPKDVNK